MEAGGGGARGERQPRRRRGIRRAALELLYGLRTEGESPGKQAAAVGIGVFIGCSPFYGLHLALCIVAARIFRLNQILTYLAAHISVPGLWPLLVIGELQVGRWLRGEPPLALTFRGVRELDPWLFAADLLIGSALVGAVLAVVLAWATYRVASRARKSSEVARLVEETSRRYIEAGVFAWEFARAKLRHDPMYFALLRSGRLPAVGGILDLGCGRGLLLALIATAREQRTRGHYPEGWPPPPAGVLRGIEMNPRRAREARVALGEEAVIQVGDVSRLLELEADRKEVTPEDNQEQGEHDWRRKQGEKQEQGEGERERESIVVPSRARDLGGGRDTPAGDGASGVELTPARAVLLLDVLHYLGAEEQEGLLDVVVQALLEPGGTLIIREADAAGGPAFRRTQAAERLCALARGHFRQKFHFRSAAEWEEMLRARGLEVTAVPMSEGTPYANVLIEGVRPDQVRGVFPP